MSMASALAQIVTFRLGRRRETPSEIGSLRSALRGDIGALRVTCSGSEAE